MEQTVVYKNQTMREVSEAGESFGELSRLRQWKESKLNPECSSSFPSAVVLRNKME